MLLSKLNLATVEFASSDETRSSINVLRITDKHIEATDGHILMRTPRVDIESDDFPRIPDHKGQDMPASINGDAGVSLKAEPIYQVLKALPRASKCRHLPILMNANAKFDKDNNALIAVTDLTTSQIIRVQASDDEYPDTERSMPTDEVQYKIAFNPAVLGSVCQFLSHFDCQSVVFSFHKPIASAAFTGRTLQGETITGVVMPVRCPE